MKIRAALPEDAGIAAKLIFASGENSLKAMFELSPRLAARTFIEHAFQQPLGQFSYSQHIVAESSNQAVAIACSWTHVTSEPFKQATLSNIVQFYGAQKTYQVIERSREVGKVIPPPLPHQLGIGHVSTLPAFQQCGMASSLIKHLHLQALDLGKSELVLDVEQSNQTAINLYRGLGFAQCGQSTPTPQGRKLGLQPHIHMVCPL